MRFRVRGQSGCRSFTGSKVAVLVNVGRLEESVQIGPSICARLVYPLPLSDVPGAIMGIINERVICGVLPAAAGRDRHEILGTNTYVPPGNNVPLTYALPLNPDLLTDIKSCGDVSFLLLAADNQIGYLFNSYFYGRGNEPLIKIIAAPGLTPPVMLRGYFTNGLFHLVGQGGANLTYQVQANFILGTTNWINLGAAIADGAGVIQYDDASTAQHVERFYRIYR